MIEALLLKEKCLLFRLKGLGDESVVPELQKTANQIDSLILERLTNPQPFLSKSIKSNIGFLKSIIKRVINGKMS